ncbi:MAG TPA: helix-turn-helix domain-containing protein [Chthoniobacteraceae bacterium]|nr:helix-turn-helix domain-containing protein [Chthoniobacteraceae bacterium]
MPEEKRVAEALESIHRATGGELCIKVLDARRKVETVLGRVAVRYQLHASRFCMEVKQTRTLHCIECDLRRVPVLCMEKRRPFEHTCHAGAGEVIVPVILDERLAAMAYLGQYRFHENDNPQLPWLTSSQRRQLLGLAELLQAYLTRSLETLRFSRESSPGLRGERIRLFLEKNLRQNPGLAELGRHLGLSETRTAHVVREATGVSFTALRDTIRLERARNLLQSTWYKVAGVAAECGFSSSQYFHRFFKQQTGLTPDAYRRRYRAEV